MKIWVDTIIPAPESYDINCHNWEELLDAIEYILVKQHYRLDEISIGRDILPTEHEAFDLFALKKTYEDDFVIRTH